MSEPTRRGSSSIGRSSIEADLLAATLDAAVEAIAMIDAGGTILRVNPATERLFGYARSELVGAPVTTLMPEPDRSRHQGYIERYLATGEAHIIGIGREVIGRRKDGTTFPLDLSVGECRHRDRRLFVGLMRDLSERKRLLDAQHAAQREAQESRERLAQVNRLSMLGELAAGIAHELNQPLGAISNYAQAAKRILERGDPDAPKQIELLEKIAAQALRAGKVIARVRAHARQRRSERGLLDLNRTLRDISRLELETTHPGVHIELRLDPGLPPVLADEIEVQQVALNLMRNGIEAMAETGGELVVATSMSDGEALVAVSDRGQGIAPQDARQVMNPFFTTKATGMGMGLAICQSIVASHGGRLWFDHNLDGPGVTFKFTLPLVQVAERSDQTEEPVAS